MEKRKKVSGSWYIHYICREDLKLKIDYSNEIIDKVEQTQKECTLLTEKIKLITVDIEKSKNDFNNLIDKFESFEIDDDKYLDITKKVNDLKPEFSDLLKKLKASLLNDKEYEFKFNPIIELEEYILGELINSDMVRIILN